MSTIIQWWPTILTNIWEEGVEVRVKVVRNRVYLRAAADHKSLLYYQDI